jgi:hypothetical protein
MCWPVGKAERRYAGVTHINVNETGDEAGSSRIKSILSSNNVTFPVWVTIPIRLTRMRSRLKFTSNTSKR